MLHSLETMRTYATALSIPHSISLPFIKKVGDWSQKSGPEWTVVHLKSIYTDFIRYRAGLQPVGKWYAKTRDGLPLCASALFSYSMKGKKQRFAVSQLLRVYTIFMTDTPTERQVNKFMEGVNADVVSVPLDITEGVIAGAKLVCNRFRLSSPRPFVMYQPSPSKRVPHFDGRTYPESTHWNQQWVSLDLTYSGSILKHRYRDIFDSVLGFQRGIKNFVGSRPPVRDHVGKIGLIQEPGMKLRAVANPNRVYQMALEPLGDCLYASIQNLDWDCTHNQNKATSFIQEHLRSNSTVHCVDLTGATDYFPLDLQISAMKAFVEDPQDMIGLFKDLSRSPWLMGNTTITWKKGQPLGLYPSFASFALTHGLLCFYLNGYKHENAFFILGDDIVILDDSLFLKYTEALKRLQCPISDMKSVSSNKLAEFAGKIIYRDDVVPQLKWRQFSDDSFVDAIRLLGSNALRLLRPRQRKVVRAIWDIPDFLGGIGFNPDGIPLEIRYLKYLDLFGEDLGTYLMSYDRHYSGYFHNHVATAGVLAYPVFEGIKELPDLDLRSLALVSKYLPKLNKLHKVLGTNLYSVVPNGDLLPIEGKTKARVTLLEMLERKLS